jgi:hypothetical protein
MGLGSQMREQKTAIANAPAAYEARARGEEERTIHGMSEPSKGCRSPKGSVSQENVCARSRLGRDIEHPSRAWARGRGGCHSL